MRFEWDPDKAAANLQKHGVGFDEAREVFNDPNAIEEFDADHSIEENRFTVIGFSRRRLLLVVFTERAGDAIRVISARNATRRERSEYEQTSQGQ